MTRIQNHIRISLPKDDPVYFIVLATLRTLAVFTWSMHRIVKIEGLI